MILNGASHVRSTCRHPSCQALGSIFVVVIAALAVGLQYCVGCVCDWAVVGADLYAAGCVRPGEWHLLVLSILLSSAAGAILLFIRIAADVFAAAGPVG